MSSTLTVQGPERVVLGGRGAGEHATVSPARVGCIEVGLSVRGRIVRVVDGGEVEDDLVRGLSGVLTSLGARRYGKRAAGDRAEQALAAAREADA